MSENASWVLFGITVLVSLILITAPVPFPTPDWFLFLRPDWLVLCWFFWVLVQPRRCSLTVAFLVGLFADVLLDEPLGLNSTLLLTLVFVGNQASRFIQTSPGPRSIVVLLLLTFLFTVTKSVVTSLSYDVEILTMSLIIPPLVTTVFWLPFIPTLSSSFSQFNEEIE